MNPTNRDVRAFTLIELLIVIAIIAVLASVIVPKLMGAREKAQEMKTMASLASAQKVAVVCLDNRLDLSGPTVGAPICTGSNDWPAPVGDLWAYGNAPGCTFDGDTTDNAFMFCATNGTRVITCTERRCAIE